MKYYINSNLRIEVDQKKDDCHKEAPHCHIARNGYRVAQVWLQPVSVEYGHSLDRREVKLVLEEVSAHRSELERQYLYNQVHGAD